MFKPVSPVATFSLKKVKWQERGREDRKVGSGALGRLAYAGRSRNADGGWNLRLSQLCPAPLLSGSQILAYSAKGGTATRCSPNPLPRTSLLISFCVSQDFLKRKLQQDAKEHMDNFNHFKTCLFYLVLLPFDLGHLWHKLRTERANNQEAEGVLEKKREGREWGVRERR